MMKTPEILEKELPKANDCEERVLSSLLQNGSRDSAYMVAKKLKLHHLHFYKESHAKIYIYVVQAIEEGNPLDLILLIQKLKDEDQLENFGGISKVTEIVTCEQLHTNFRVYAELIIEKAVSRKIIECSLRDKDLAYESESPEMVIKSLQNSLELVKGMRTPNERFKDAQRAYKEFLESIEARTSGEGLEKGITTGLHQDIDEHVSILAPNVLTIVGAKPGTGKTALCVDLANSILKQDLPVLFFTLEITADMVMQRLVCNKGNIPMQYFKDLKLAPKMSLSNIKHTSKELSQTKLKIQDSAGLSISDIISMSEEQGEEGKIGLICIDYIGLVDLEQQSGETKADSYSRAFKALKQLAKKLKCPIVVPSQLNDNNQLKGSRAGGEDGDIVLILLEDNWQVAKNRNGKSDFEIPLVLNGSTQRFELPQANYNK